MEASPTAWFNMLELCYAQGRVLDRKDLLLRRSYLFILLTRSS